MKTRVITFFAFLAVGAAILTPALLSEAAARFILGTIVAVLCTVALLAAIVFVAYRVHLRLNEPLSHRDDSDAYEATGIQILDGNADGGDIR
jgi:uncharacterized membrane protein